MTSNAVFKKSLIWGVVVFIAIAIVAGTIGSLTLGTIGLVSALIGSAIGVFFLSVTAVSIIFANRFQGSPTFPTIFFGIVLGGWFVKFAVVLVLLLILRGQPWIDPLTLFVCLIAGALATITVDVVVALSSRVPYTGAGTTTDDTVGSDARTPEKPTGENPAAPTPL